MKDLKNYLEQNIIENNYDNSYVLNYFYHVISKHNDSISFDEPVILKSAYKGHKVTIERIYIDNKEIYAECIGLKDDTIILSELIQCKADADAINDAIEQSVK